MYYFLHFNGVTWNVYEDMRTSLPLTPLNDIDHHDDDDDDQIVMMTHSVIQNIAINIVKLFATL